MHSATAVPDLALAYRMLARRYHRSHGVRPPTSARRSLRVAGPRGQSVPGGPAELRKWSVSVDLLVAWQVPTVIFALGHLQKPTGKT